MINKKEDISFITDENGKEIPIHVIREFDNISNGKKFVIYCDIEDPKDNDIEREFYVAEIVKCPDGTEEIAEIESEEDLAYCQEVFDSMYDDLISTELSDTEDDEGIEPDEDDGDTILS